jgi:hypothetical protein
MINAPFAGFETKIALLSVLYFQGTNFFRCWHVGISTLVLASRRFVDFHRGSLAGRHRLSYSVLTPFYFCLGAKPWRLCVKRSDNRQLHAALYDPRADRIPGQPCCVVDIEFGHEMFPVLLDSFDADAKFRRGFLVGLAFGDELEHFHLA